MKRIHLSEGQPNDITSKDLRKETYELFSALMTMADKSGLSYVEINKALYLADKGLYFDAINSKRRY